MLLCVELLQCAVVIIVLIIVSDFFFVHSAQFEAITCGNLANIELC